MTSFLTIVAALLVSLPCVFGMRQDRQANAEIHALRYATLQGFPVASLVVGADTSRRLDIAMMIWLVKRTDGRIVLVDAGFYRDRFIERWKPAAYSKPSDVVRAMGVMPEAVTDIIVTHVHWDHLDGADLFPNARVWIQRDEFEHHVGEGGKVLDRAIDALDAAMLTDLHRAGRLHLVDGDAQEVMPGITVYTGGKHTFASQYVAVTSTRGTVVLASDNAYLYENISNRTPIAQTLDRASNVQAMVRMSALAGPTGDIVPGHDPLVFQKFAGGKIR